MFVGELTDPETLDGLMDGIDVVFSSVGISRQRDRLTIDQVDYGCNHTLIQLASAGDVEQFVYVSMQGADEPELADLAITRAHGKVVRELQASDLDERIVRPRGYFSDTGALLRMAKRGLVLLVGDGENRMSPIRGRDLAEVCVAAVRRRGARDRGGRTRGDDPAGGGRDRLRRRGQAGPVPGGATVVLGGLAKGIGFLSKQFGDLAEFIVVASEVDGVGPPLGTTTLRSYFEELAADGG